jgi:hypothetical protein
MSQFERLARRYLWMAGLMVMLGVALPACTAEMMPTFPELEQEEEEDDEDEEEA